MLLRLCRQQDWRNWGGSEEELLGRKSTDSEKQALTWLSKKHTTVTGVWLAERLRLGHRVNTSRATSWFNQAEERPKSEMLQCTG